MYGALRCEYYIASEVKSLGYQIEAQQEDELGLNSEEDLWTIRPILCLPSLQSLEKSYKTCRYIRWKWNCWNPSVCLPQSMSILCSRQKSRGSGGLKYHPCCVCPPGFWGTALHTRLPSQRKSLFSIAVVTHEENQIWMIKDHFLPKDPFRVQWSQKFNIIKGYPLWSTQVNIPPTFTRTLKFTQST